MTSILTLVASNAVIASILALITVVLTRSWRSPQLAHGLWLLVLLKLVTPPLFNVSVPSEWLLALPEPIESSSRATVGVENEVGGSGLASSLETNFDLAATMAAGDTAIAEPHASADRGGDTAVSIRDSVVVVAPGAGDRAFDFASPHWPTFLGAVWIAGAIVYFSLLVRRCISFRRLLATSVAADEEIKALATRLASRIGLRRSPPIRTVEIPIPPLVWSLALRPLIVLPAKLLADLSPAQRDALIAHELTHVRRRDHLVRWLEAVALVLCWWNPVAWFARRKLREAEEECCDAWVVWALPDQRRSYGEAMLATIEFVTDGSKLPVLAESAFGGSFCKRRIEMIMKRNVNRKISWSALGMVVLMSVMVLPIVAQTTETQETAKDAKPQDATAETEAGAATIAKTTTDAVETEKAASDSRGQTPSTEEILKRISRLEQLLQSLADQHAPTGPTRGVSEGEAGEPPDTVRSSAWRRARGDSGPSNVAHPPLPVFNVSSDKEEQELQEQLLKLDVEAARAHVQHTRSELDVSLEAIRNTPRSVSHVEIARQRATLDFKKVQVQRAEMVLELFKKQVQRKREEDARRNVQNSATDDRNRQLHEVRRRAERVAQLARLKELNQRAADKVRDLEQRLKDSPDSPEAWQAVEEFLELYRSTVEQETKPESEPSRATSGGRR